jgi:hypothetical protein
MEIRVFRNEDKQEVLEILRLGLKDQEHYAGLVDPPEDDGFF